MGSIADLAGEGFSRRLREACRRKGWNGSTLSERTGLAHGLCYRYLTGQRTPGAANLAILSVALGVSAGWLIGLED